MITDPRIRLANELFEAWSSGDADAPQRFFHPDGVLADIVGGEHHGWPAIRAFFSGGIAKWPDLVLVPEDHWTNDGGVALSWTMSATVPEGSSLGAGAVGCRWRSPGMTWLSIVDGRVRREVDYHDSGAVRSSLGLGAAQ